MKQSFQFEKRDPCCACTAFATTKHQWHGQRATSLATISCTMPFHPGGDTLQAGSGASPVLSGIDQEGGAAQWLGKRALRRDVRRHPVPGLRKRGLLVAVESLAAGSKGPKEEPCPCNMWRNL